MADWRLARALDVLRAEVDAEYPGRSKISDGTLGDAAHSARKSDHNPARYPGAGSTPVVRAFDVTASGIDADAYAERIRALGLAGDRRLNPNGYVIWNRRIASAQHGWRWRPYTGANGHTQHVHTSVGTDPAGFDSTAPWGIARGTRPPAPEDDDDMFTDEDRKLLRGVSNALLVDIAEGRDDATEGGTLAKMVRSMFMGDYGERGGGKYLRGSLGWLDRRLARRDEALRKAIVADVLAALGQEPDLHVAVQVGPEDGEQS
jgi:hypothetical protein